jgi:hypothetical protein
MELSPEDVDALLAALQGPVGDSATLSPRLKASESSTDSASSDAKMTTKTKTMKKAPCRRRSSTPTRDKEMAELRALRVIEQELQSLLSALRVSIATPGRVRGQQALLRYVARRQLALRRDAERTNRSLREQMTTQHRLSRELVARMSAQFRANVLHPHHMLNEEDRVMLAKLADRIDRIYDMLPAAFPKDDTAKRVECARAVDRFLESMGGEVADGGMVQLPGSEIRDDRELPFNFYSVIDATWRAMTAWHAGGNGTENGWMTSHSFLGVERPEHTFAVRVGLQSESNARLPVYFSEKVVVRRYIEPGRFVVVWLGSYDGEVELLGSRAVELGWIVVEQLPARGDSPTPALVETRSTNDDAPRDGRVRIRLYGRVIPTTKYINSQSCEQILASTSTKSCQEDFSFIYRHMAHLLSASSTHT